MLLDEIGTALFVACGIVAFLLAPSLWAWNLYAAAKRARGQREKQQDAHRLALLEAKSLACAEREASEIRVMRAVGGPQLEKAMLEYAFAVGQVAQLDARLDGDEEGARTIGEGQRVIANAIRSLEVPAGAVVVTETYLDRVSKAAWN